MRAFECGGVKPFETLCFGHGIVVTAAITHQIRIPNPRVARWQLTTRLDPCGGQKAHTKPIATHNLGLRVVARSVAQKR